MAIPFFRGEVPRVTAGEMREVDRIMTEELGVDLMQMMENAGGCLARLAGHRFLNGHVWGKEVVVLAGSGGNGGGAAAAARRLHTRGCRVRLYSTKPVKAMAGGMALQSGILRRMDVPLLPAASLTSTDLPELIIDGVIGYSIAGPPAGEAAKMIEWANRSDAPLLSLDLPSGLDATTGQAYEPTIHASATLTLALPKTGLFGSARGVAGEIYLADIGVPPSVFAKAGVAPHIGEIFSMGDMVRID